MAISDSTNTLENFIWEEISHAFCYSHKIRKYVDNRKKYNRWSNWLIVIISTFAGISYWFSSQMGAIGATIVAILTIVKTIAPIFNQPQEELTQLNIAADFYAKYLPKMEKLLLELQNGLKHPVFCEEEFFTLKEGASQYLTITNNYYRGIWSFQEKNINTKFDEYVKRIYNESAETQL